MGYSVHINFHCFFSLAVSSCNSYLLNCGGSIRNGMVEIVNKCSKYQLKMKKRVYFCQRHMITIFPRLVLTILLFLKINASTSYYTLVGT